MTEKDIIVSEVAKMVDAWPASERASKTRAVRLKYGWQFPIRCIKEQIKANRNAGTDWDCEALVKDLNKLVKYQGRFLRKVAKNLFDEIIQFIRVGFQSGKHWEKVPYKNFPKLLEENFKPSFTFRMMDSLVDDVFPEYGVLTINIKTWDHTVPNFDISTLLSLMEQSKGSVSLGNGSEHNKPTFFMLGNYKGLHFFHVYINLIPEYTKIEV